MWAGVADYADTLPWNLDDPDVAALEACRRMQTSSEFVAVHCHVFTPESLRDPFDKLARLDLVDFEVASVVPNEVGSLEFIVGLRLVDPSTGREKMRATQLQSVAQVSHQPPPERAGVQLTGMVVSPRETVGPERRTSRPASPL